MVGLQLYMFFLVMVYECAFLALNDHLISVCMFKISRWKTMRASQEYSNVNTIRLNNVNDLVKLDV